MTSIDQVFDSVGLIIVLTEIVTITVTGRGRNRKENRNVQTSVNYGTGFIVDGTTENGILKNSTTSNSPSIVSVAHLIPGGSTNNQFFIKLFNNQTKISKIHPISLEFYNRSIDVCTFKFVNIPPNIQCLQWNLSNIKSGDFCYITGYPLGDAQLSIVGGYVRDPTYCFTNFESGIDQLYHSGSATNGNSGSCVLDISGNIIGMHGWAYNQGPGVTFENFCGGPSTHSLYPILNHMIKNSNLAVNKYFPRVALCISAQIMDDIFRIQNFNNSSLNNIDGIVVKNVYSNSPNFTIHAHNLKPGTIKILPGDLITSIFDNDKNEYVNVGYSKEAPVNILFRNPLFSQIKIKIRKAPLYNDEQEIILTNPFVTTVSQDIFNSTFL
jgi:S1-C subfamily serine protease